MRTSAFFAGAIVLLLIITGCPKQQEGTLQGSVVPPSKGVLVRVSQNDRPITAVEVQASDGAFHVQLPAGTYDISLVAPSSPFPLRLAGIVISPKQTTVLPPVVLAAEHGSASIRGNIHAAGASARVTLIAEGIERASMTTTGAGAYLFENIPAGSYVLNVEAPGYASDTVRAAVGNGQRRDIDVPLLYRTAIDGVDWEKGTLRARGIGSPPREAPTPTIRREMAKRAAFVDAERNLLRAVQLLQVGPEERLSAFPAVRDAPQRLQGYVQGFRVAAERDLDGGRVEVELELPLTGPAGLMSALRVP